MRRWIEGIVVTLRCRACGGLTPHLIFSADTDMATMGYASLSSISANEVVAFDAEPPEYADFSGKSGDARINAQLSRDDLRNVPLLRVGKLGWWGMFRPPVCIYACPRCRGGEAAAIRSQTPSAYVRAGGKVKVVGDFEVRG